jgi:PadR family transcriptional regulator PadR
MTKDEYIDIVGTKMKGGIFSLLVLYIITSSSKPVHGYAITKGLTEGTGERIYIQAGTLYPILKNLEAHGLIRHRMVDSTEGPPRKVYRTTKDGKRALTDGMGLLGNLLAGVQMTMGEDWPVLNVHG